MPAARCRAARQAVDDRSSGRRLLHARIAESAGARQVPCKPERLRAIVDDTRKLMEGINRLTSFLVDEARCSDAVATLWQRAMLQATCGIRATYKMQHAAYDMQPAARTLPPDRQHAPYAMPLACNPLWPDGSDSAASCRGCA
jgi:hypothetical protein